MPRPTMIIKATELYYNKQDIDLLLKVDTTNENYPNDEEKFITTEEQTKLRNLLKGAKYDSIQDCYKKLVEFQKKSYGDVSFGRNYPKAKVVSAQGIWKPIRDVLFDDKVVGFDIINSQPSILLQLCKRYAPFDRFEFLEKYEAERDQVRRELMEFYNLPKSTIKDFMIRLCFGGSVQNIYKTYQLQPHVFLDGFYNDTTKIKTETCHLFPNFDKAEKVYRYRKENDLLKNEYSSQANSAIATYLQDIEGSIMLTVYEAFKNDLQVVSVIHDEICFVNDDYLRNNIESVMCRMENVVESKLDFKIKLHHELYKKDDEFVKRHLEFRRKLKEEPDDIRNGKILYELLKDKARYSKKQGKWLYDDRKGLWTCDECHFKQIVYKHANEFVQTKADKDGFIVEHHERDIGTMYRNIMEYFWTLVDNQEKLNSDHNRGFLLFKNGVLDCYNMEMLPFDQKYHFTRRINRDFDITKDYTEGMRLVKEKVFETAYTTGDGDTEKMDYFMEILAIALMEGGVDKKYLTMLGETNSGKGVLTAYLQNAFDEFVSTFNTSVLMVGQNSNLEDASKWRFLTKCYDTRIMIGNEISIQSDDTTDAFGHRKRTERPLNIDMIKTLVSGGDSVEARRMRENEISIVNKAFVLMLANDMPKTGADTAFANRSLVMNACRSSTLEDNFNDELFFKADPDIKQWIEKTDMCDALIVLMCDIYKKVKHNRTKTPEWVLATVKEYVKCEGSFQWVNENYDVYEGCVEKDFDAVKSTKQYYKVDWNKVGDHCVRADVMYNLYKDSGGTDSQTKFGTMLTKQGILPVQRKVKGSVVVYRVGVSIPRDDARPFDIDPDYDEMKRPTVFDLAFPR
jgi:phage/plasmid-associated DNA primase